MHTSDSIANSMDSTVFNALNRCQSVLLEADLANVPDAQRMAELMSMPDGQWCDLFTDEELSEVNRYLEHRLPPMAQLLKESMYPVFILFMVQQMEELERIQSEPNALFDEAMDVRFHRMAAANGLATHGLETWEEQMKSVSEMALDVQAKLLIETARGKHFSRVITNDIVDHYYAQNLTAMAAVMDAEDALQRIFFDAVLFSRNDRFVQRALRHFAKGPTFMAVGALHLAGDRGVLEQFRQHGYTVEQVPFTFLKYHSSHQK
jgi:uncharacterized protein YbaP (TraB family)